MDLNKKQKIILILGIIAFIIFSLTTDTIVTYGGHHGIRLVALTDYGPLIVRLFSTIFATSGLLVIFKNEKKN